MQASTFDARYGRGVGGVVNVVTRSGTNQLHGTVFEYLRNYELNAANFFSGRDAVKRNQFGFSAGGPVTLPGALQRQGPHRARRPCGGSRARARRRSRMPSASSTSCPPRMAACTCWRVTATCGASSAA